MITDKNQYCLPVSFFIYEVFTAESKISDVVSANNSVCRYLSIEIMTENIDEVNWKSENPFQFHLWSFLQSVFRCREKN